MYYRTNGPPQSTKALRGGLIINNFFLFYYFFELVFC